MPKSVLSILACAGCAAMWASPAFAQLRIVTMNASNSSNGNTGPRTGMQTILTAMGDTVLDDPTNGGASTGIAKKIDVLCLQETHLNGTTPGQYATLLNTMYGTTTFGAGTLVGASTGSGSQSVVFNSATVALLGEGTVGVTSPTGMARQAIRHQFRPVGYGSAADFYIYNSHYKASSGDTARRLVEAQLIRTDADGLGQGKNVIYLGDYNVFTSSESGYQHLLSAGNGQAFDPINQPGAWNGSATFKNIHTQTPYDASIGQPGFDGAGGMDSRFDIQLITGEMTDANGLAYIANSYQSFGNNGTHLLGDSLNTGTGAAPEVLTALSSILDHLPVGADYQLPARMGANVAGVPGSVITGASVPVNVTVTNTAPVMFANGADGLTYAVSSAGNVSGSGNGTNLLAMTSGNVHSLALSTATPGISGGTVNVSSSSEAVADGTFSQGVSTTVLAHATPSFQGDATVNVATIDFGIHGRTLGDATASFSVANRGHPSGFTAKLDLDSVLGSGDIAALFTNAVTFANLSAGSSNAFVATISDAANGSFTATYTLNLSDENLPGATTVGPLTLHLSGIIATPGDADLSDFIDFDDYVAIDAGYNGGLSGWSNGDFDGNATIDFDDYVLIDLFFNIQGGGGRNGIGNPLLARALQFLSGEDRSSAGMDALSLGKIAQHFNEFGSEYAQTFLAAVPEPASVLSLSGLAVSFASFRRKRQRRIPWNDATVHA